MVNVVPREVPRPKNPLGLWPLGFWPWDLPRDSIHHDTPSAFPNNVPLFNVGFALSNDSYELSIFGFQMSNGGLPLSKCYIMY